MTPKHISRAWTHVRRAFRPPRWARLPIAAAALVATVATLTYHVGVIQWHYFSSGSARIKPRADFRMDALGILQKAITVASDPSATLDLQSPEIGAWHYVSPGRKTLSSSDATLSVTIPEDLPTNLIGRYLGLPLHDRHASVVVMPGGAGLVVAVRGVGCDELLYMLAPYGVAMARAGWSMTSLTKGDPEAVSKIQWSERGQAGRTCDHGPRDGRFFLNLGPMAVR